MKLPFDILSQGYTKPKLYLCEADKQKICELETTSMSGSFKFNAYSELTFTVPRVYTNMIVGSTDINPYYNKIESLRLVCLEGFGYFEIQGPGLNSDGIKETKSITAYSLEYTLSTKFLKKFYINTGKVDSHEVLNSSSPDHIVPITLYNQSNPKLSLLHLVLNETPGWTIGHVDASLQTLSRQFEIDRKSVYDFLMNDVCEKFNCYITFDTFNNKINIYAESLTSKFIGDGKTNMFMVSPPFSQISTVSVNGYKTTRWSYNSSTGALTLEDVPSSGAHIEVVDGALTGWETDVFIGFDNLAQEIDISYDADAIKTQLVVTYGDDLDIREANLGSPYLTDLSYYYTVDWMGQDLYDAYTAYLQKSNQYQSEYTNNAKEMLDILNKINFAESRLSLEYSVAPSVNAMTVGTYYVKVGTSPNHYYKEVSLPADYNVNTIYYSDATANLQDTADGNVRRLYETLKQYFNNTSGWGDSLNSLSTVFDFMETHTISWLHSALLNVTSNKTSNSVVEMAIDEFLGEMWDQIGLVPLQSLYYEQYKQIQVANIEAGWSQTNSNEYGSYYPVVLYLNSINKAIEKRKQEIKVYENEYKDVQNRNITIGDALLMNNNFTNDQIIRLSAFLREDELHIDDIVETDLTSVNESFTLKQDAMEAGRIKLQKLCQPQLQFTMNMANIYALHEFEPIINQFQLGNVIKVGLRPDYIKQSRLLQVNFNFDDFSDFSCEFGELTGLRTQSDIHADLLSQAISAGKSVATNSSYWTQGADRATNIDLRLQEGLLNSIEAIKSMDGNQNAYMDKWGIHLEAVNPDTGEISDKRVWLVNNQIVFTDDGFKTSKSVLGEFTVGGEAYYGLLAQAIIAGYIESSTIIGGTIQIGLQQDGTYAFEVHEDGSVTMNGGGNIAGYATQDDLQEIKNSFTTIGNSAPYSPINGQMWLDTSVEPNVLKIYENGQWVNFSKQGQVVYTSRPTQYSEGDIWILGKGEEYTIGGVKYKEGSILRADLVNGELVWVDAMAVVTDTINNIKESFMWDDQGIKVMKRVTYDDGKVTHPFYVQIDSTRMGFHSVEYDENGNEKNDIEVVHIGNNSSTIQNAIFQGNAGTKFENAASFEQQINMYKPNTTTGFAWKIENNGSLSLSIT